jgi:MerR family copper efflux transcriptional regulator
MSTAFRIAEVARRSGFTPASLRYYEEIGLLPRPERTEAGYRMYDERTLERLAFIQRAKQLGCTLEEIADLSIAWDGGECGPVQDRLRATVAAKLADAQARIVELMTLTGELRRAAAVLEQHRPDGPCDDRCGCINPEDPMATEGGSGTKRSGADQVSIACTLPAESMSVRSQDWQRILASATSRSVLNDGVRLEFDPDVPVDELIRLAVAEQECCRFFAFALTIDQRDVGLEVRAPDDAAIVVQSLFGPAA